MAALFDCAVLCRAANPAVSMWIPVCCYVSLCERARPPTGMRVSPRVCTVYLRPKTL